MSWPSWSLIGRRGRWTEEACGRAAALGPSITGETVLIETLVEEPAEWGTSSVLRADDMAGYTGTKVGMDKGCKGEKGQVRVLK